MPKTVTRDHHSLRRNLKLNDNYLSNDGDDEGILINDSGEITSAVSAQAIEINGFSEYFTVSDHSSLDMVDAITISFWMNPASFDDWERIIDKETYTSPASNDDGFLVAFLNSSIYFRINETATLEASTDITLNTWTHVVCTYDKSTMKIYHNSVVDSNITDDYSAAIVANANPLYIGRYTASVAYTFGGKLQEMAIWDVALTQAQITAIYNSGSQRDLSSNFGDYTVSGDLAAYWKMDEGTGTSLTDSSTNSNTASGTGIASDNWVSGKSSARLEVKSDTVNVYENLVLNNNYISNDGGDEGIKISDIGAVTIDSNSTSTIEQTTKGLEIDYDHTGSTDENQEIMGLDVSAVSTTTTGGEQALYGAKISSQLSCASGAGSTNSFGLYVTAVGDQTAAVDWATAAYLEASGTDLNTGLYIKCANGGDDLKIVSSVNTTDYFKIQVGVDGETTFTTNEAAGGNDSAHLNINLEGNLVVDAVGDITLDAAGGDVTILQADLNIPSGNKVFLGADEEYISGDGTDIHFGVGSGGDINIPANIGLTFGDDGEKIEGNGTYLSISSSGNVRFIATGEIDFGSTSATFTRQTGTDAVSIDWGEGNKYDLLLNNSSTVTFATNPSGACNLLLKVAQGDGGSNTITWAVTSGTIYWAGGGVLNTDEPTLTTTDDKTDILTFYFDGTNYFGVASLDFDTT